MMPEISLNILDVAENSIRAGAGYIEIDVIADISLIDHRHIAYNQNLQAVFALEREGKAFVFAPSHPIHVGTYLPCWTRP